MLVLSYSYLECLVVAIPSVISTVQIYVIPTYKASIFEYITH